MSTQPWDFFVDIGHGFVERWSRPRVVSVDGETWTVGTDGVRLVALRGVEGPFDALDLTPVDEGLLTVAPGEAVVPMADLRAWAGEWKVPDPAEEVPCEECNGEGTVEHWCDCEHCDEYEVDCGDCDGEGVIFGPEPPVRAGFLGPALLNLNIMAWALAHLDADTVRVRADGPQAAVYIDAPGWRFLLMPLRGMEDYGQRDQLPRIDLHAESSA